MMDLSLKLLKSKSRPAKVLPATLVVIILLIKCVYVSASSFCTHCQLDASLTCQSFWLERQKGKDCGFYSQVPLITYTWCRSNKCCTKRKQPVPFLLHKQVCFPLFPAPIQFYKPREIVPLPYLIAQHRIGNDTQFPEDRCQYQNDSRHPEQHSHRSAPLSYSAVCPP